jgi:hypothetical protein
VNLDSEDAEIAPALSALGHVSPPASDVLANAREMLWSAVSEEMLADAGADAGAGRGEQNAADQRQRPGRQRRSDGPSEGQQRRTAGSGD